MLGPIVSSRSPGPEPWTFTREFFARYNKLGEVDKVIEAFALVGVDSHPGMLESLRRRLPDTELIQSRIEDLDLGRRFHLVIVPSNILCLVERLRSAANHLADDGSPNQSVTSWLAKAIVSIPCAMTPGRPAERAKASSRWIGLRSPDASA